MEKWQTLPRGLEKREVFTGKEKNPSLPESSAGWAAHSKDGFFLWPVGLPDPDPKSAQRSTEKSTGSAAEPPPPPLPRLGVLNRKSWNPAVRNAWARFLLENSMITPGFSEISTGIFLYACGDLSAPQPASTGSWSLLHVLVQTHLLPRGFLWNDLLEGAGTSLSLGINRKAPMKKGMAASPGPAPHQAPRAVPSQAAGQLGAV